MLKQNRLSTRNVEASLKDLDSLYSIAEESLSERNLDLRHLEAVSSSRGHITIYYKGKWVFLDTLEPENHKRPCKRCGHPPTSKGHDYCCQNIKGATAACCGHGIRPGYILWNNGICEDM